MMWWGKVVVWKGGDVVGKGGGERWWCGEDGDVDEVLESWSQSRRRPSTKKDKVLHHRPRPTVGRTLHWKIHKCLPVV